MKLQTWVNDREVKLPSDECCDVTEVEPGVYSVLLNGCSYVARVVRENGAYAAEIRGRRFHVEARDPRDASSHKASRTGSGRQSITASMPGKVVRLLVQTGGTVEAGQGLMVVEAMKMQNEIKAPKPGTVSSIQVSEGSTVKAGEVLMVIENPGASAEAG